MEYLLKASAVIAIFYFCFFFLLKKETFFQHNRSFLLLGLIIALIFPLIVIPNYIVIESIPITETTFTPNSLVNTNETYTTTEQSFNWLNLFSILYYIGLSIFFSQFLFQFGSLIVLLLKNPKQKDQQFTYVIINSKVTPFSFFKWIVYNPKNYSADELEIILTHEKTHAKQLHSIDILFTQLACVVFWFNPLIWLYRKEIQQNLEYIADLTTLKNSTDKKEYQHLLLKTSVANHNMSITNNFFNSSIKKRILMLNKSRSKKKNQLKYLLMIPLLGAMLLSMNTKNIYVDNVTSVSVKDSTIEFVVTKTTTDKELKSMSNSIEQKGGTLVFSQIKRNTNNELIDIFLELNNHKYGGGNSKNTIDAFIIYKEFSGYGGGYVGRINGATIHFDEDHKIYDNTILDQLTKRAHQAILKAGIYNENELKNSNLHNTKNKIQNNTKKEKSGSQVISESIKVKFTKDMNSESLDKMAKFLKLHNVTMFINKIKRNNDNEIANIAIEFITEYGSTIYKEKDQNGIDPFYFEMNDDGNFKVSTFQNHDENTTGNRLQTSMGKAKSKDTITITIDTLRVNRSLEKPSQIYYEDVNSNTTQITKEENKNLQTEQNKIDNIRLSNSQNPKPLIIVDGKEVHSDSLKKLNPDDIEGIIVLKDEKAIKTYGEKGKNGVIVISLKDNNSWSSDSERKHITYTDNENDANNGTLFYISKNSTDDSLESYKMELSKKGIIVKYSKIRRNKLNEITSLKISISNNNGSKSSGNWKSNSGIPNIEFGISEETLIARSIE
ncbi:M56 family metallopeptidase [uncultured Winogradskyella sp.]|uniref:M56 family metallopeptidase n=1 Tax=uncultured Winogradskyella sp. TaxID=395353 RepID=UPI00260D66B7|nr:M56 family metallopeptidase [uncultured Winogradskyella sp.]